MKLDVYINRLKTLEANYTDLVFQLLVSKENYVLAIPKRRLYNFGTDANDVKITPLYRPSTIVRKLKSNQRASHVTLRDSGDLYSTFKMVKEQNAIDFTAPNNFKTDFLVNHYSSNELFGFAPSDEEEIYKLFIKPAIEEIIYGVDVDIEF